MTSGGDDKDMSERVSLTDKEAEETDRDVPRLSMHRSTSRLSSSRALFPGKRTKTKARSARPNGKKTKSRTHASTGQEVEDSDEATSHAGDDRHDEGGL